MADDHPQPGAAAGDDLLKMFGSSSTSRRSRRGYQRLDPAQVPEYEYSSGDAKRGADAVGTGVLASPAARGATHSPSLKKSASTSASRTKSHPLFSLFTASGRKKPKMKPELVRYLDYLKEGGTWDPTTNRPVIYFK